MNDCIPEFIHSLIEQTLSITFAPEVDVRDTRGLLEELTIWWCEVDKKTNHCLRGIMMALRIGRPVPLGPGKASLKR